MDNLHRSKEKKMAYVLFVEFGYTKQSIAQLMKISPQQMGQWVKEMTYEVRINQLNNEISEIKNDLLRLGYSPQRTLNHDDFDF